jgi:hypothetical protein
VDQIPILTQADESEGLDSTTKYEILTGSVLDAYVGSIFNAY